MHAEEPHPLFIAKAIGPKFYARAQEIMRKAVE